VAEVKYSGMELRNQIIDEQINYSWHVTTIHIRICCLPICCLKK